MKGIEVYNHDEFFPKTLNWAKEKNLTVTANSDVHVLIDMMHDELSHRPMTLVLAKDKSNL